MDGCPIVISLSPHSLVRKARGLYEAILTLEAHGVELKTVDPSNLDPERSKMLPSFVERDVSAAQTSSSVAGEGMATVGGLQPLPPPATGGCLSVTVIGRKMAVADVAITPHACLCVRRPRGQRHATSAAYQQASSDGGSHTGRTGRSRHGLPAMIHSPYCRQSVSLATDLTIPLLLSMSYHPLSYSL